MSIKPVSKKKKQNEAESLIQELRTQSKPTTKTTPKKSVKMEDEDLELEVKKSTPSVVSKEIKTKPITKLEDDPSFNDPLVILSKRCKHFQSISDRTLYAIYLQGFGEFKEYDIKNQKGPLVFKVSRGNKMKFGNLFGTLKVGNVLYYIIKHNHLDSDDYEMLFEPLEILRNYNPQLKNN